MLSRVHVPISNDMRSDALEVQLAAAGATLLIDTLNRIEDGTATETPQDASLVTYAARLDRRDSHIDWTRSARDIHNQIRAMHLWPLTSVMWRGKRLIVRASSLDTSAGLGEQAGLRVAPGTIVSVGSDRLEVQAGDRLLSITEVQPEGRKPQTAREFINGARPAVGDRFEAVPVA